jgi:ADP-heptose:LPS heptosyltransferase
VSAREISPERILVYRLGSLGDTVAALPCFHQIRRSFPQARITLLTNVPVSGKAPPLESILAPGGFFDEILSYPVGTRDFRELADLRQAISSRRIGTMVYLAAARDRFSVIRDRLFFRVCGIRSIIGLPRHERDFQPVAHPVSGLCENESLRLASRLSELGGPDLADRSLWDLKLQPHEREEAAGWKCVFHGNPFLVVAPGTKMQSKDWGESNWRSLLEKMASLLPGIGLLLVGAGEERELAARCAAQWHGPVLNLCGAANPRVAAAAMEGASLFLGHDSGPMHLASAMGLPCVVVFSARSLPGQWFPHGSDHRILYRKTSCHGCRLTDCVEEGKRCLLTITPDEVLAEVLAVLRDDRGFLPGEGVRCRS